MAKNTVTITVNKGNVAVDKEPVYVNIPTHDVVEWTGPTGCEFDIVFEDTPFDDHIFQSKGGKPATTGAVKTATGQGRKYKYTVVITSDPKVRPLDPTVRPTP